MKLPAAARSLLSALSATDPPGWLASVVPGHAAGLSAVLVLPAGAKGRNVAKKVVPRTWEMWPVIVVGSRDPWRREMEG